MRKLILNIAISLDNMILDENKGYDWIKGDGNSSNDTKKQFKFEEFLHRCDTYIMGKTSYDDHIEDIIASFKGDKIFVVTHSTEKPKREMVEFISGDIVDFINEIKKKEGKDIWLFGGANLVNQLIKADVIDEYIFGIIPTIVGKGKRLFDGDNPMIKLDMKQCTVSDGVTMLIYKKRNK